MNPDLTPGGARPHAVVRRAFPDDARAIEEVRYAGWRHAYRGIIPEAYFLAWDIAAHARERERHGFSPGHGVFVAEQSGRVVGYVAAGSCRDVDCCGWGEIMAIYVSPSTLGHGVGSALMSAGLAHLTGYPRVVVWMLRANPLAGPFYARWGFAPDGGERTQHLGGAALPEIRLSRGSRGGR